MKKTQKSNFRVMMAIGFSLLSSMDEILAYDFAVENSDGVTIYYNYSRKSDSECYVTCNNLNDYTGTVVVPASVTYGGRNFSVTSIGPEAFSFCNTLTSVSLPDNVTDIGMWAFYESNSLTSVNLPDNLTSINDEAFSGCSSLESLCLPDKLKSIGYFAFEGCSSLVSVILPENLTSLGGHAFANCSSLMSISVPNRTILESGVFAGCRSLTSITLNSDNPNYTFQDGVLFNKNKTKLLCYLCGREGDEYIIPNSVNSIEEAAFSGSNLLTSIIIPDNVSSIGALAFDGCSSLSTITLPDNITVINTGVFQNCSSLTTISLPDNLTSIGGAAFNFCSSLTTINLPEKLKSIGHRAFQMCSSLTSISLPDNIITIDDYTFHSCSSLVSISIPEKLTSIGNYVFNGCSSLTTISLPEKVTSIGNYTFVGCSLLTSITVDSGNPNYTSQDGVLFNKDKTLLLCYPCGKEGNEYVIPNSVKEIGKSAFYGCSSLMTISLPEKLSSIGNYAFEDCSSLTTIRLPYNLTTIGYAAFAYCSSLTTISLRENLTTIDDFAFYGCTSLTQAKILAKTPPAINNSVFENINLSEAILFVPVGTQTLYAESEGWRDFGCIVESDEYESAFNIYLDVTEMPIGDVQQVQVQRTPDIEKEPITWCSSNDDVATVDACGIITARAEGMAEITAYCRGLMSTCQVSVFKKEDEIVYGYCDDYVGSGVGNGSKKKIKCAIRIPASALQDYKDCTITKIDVGVSDNVTELVPVISIGGEENYAAQAAIKGYTGWNAIELDNPYVIGSQDLYVGYECVGTYAAALSNIYSQYGSFIFENGSWSDYSGQEWGSFCVRIHIKGYDLPMDVALQTDKTVECALGETLMMTPTVQNLSPEIVESLTFNCYIDGKFEGSHEVAANIGKGKIEDVSFTINSPSTPGMYNVKIQVENINGKEDENASNNTVTMPLTILGKKFNRRVVMEEITGTWCGYCVRGYHAMKTMAEKYPNNFIGIAIHGSDEMDGAKNYSSIFSLLGGSYPSSIANRNSKYKLDASLEEMEEAVLAMKDNAIADINTEVEVLDADTTKVRIKTNVEFGMNVSVPFRIAYVVVENGVGPYVQTSYYSGSNTDLGGLENEGSYISLMFNDVARGIYSGFNGVMGSVPSTIIGGEVYSYDYSMLLPDNIDNKANVEIVAMLINQNSGEIVNACKCKLKDGSSNITGIKDDSSEVSMIYGINGIRLDAPQRGLNIIRMNNGETKKVMVK